MATRPSSCPIMADTSSTDATRSVRSIERSTTKGTLVNTPPSLPRPECITEAIERSESLRIRERHVAHERNVVEAEVPDTGIDHAVGAECHDRSNDCAGKDVVPVVIFINCQCAPDKSGAQYWHVGDDELPVRWMVV